MFFCTCNWYILQGNKKHGCESGNKKVVSSSIFCSPRKWSSFRESGFHWWIQVGPLWTSKCCSVLLNKSCKNRFFLKCLKNVLIWSRMMSSFWHLILIIKVISPEPKTQVRAFLIKILLMSLLLLLFVVNISEPMCQFQ